MEITDEDIVRQVIGGDVDAFGLLVNRYTPKLERYARKFLFGTEDRADLLQEVFLKAFVNLRDFDLDRRFSPWIYRIAHNEFINGLKKRERLPTLLPDPESIFPFLVAEETALDRAEYREIKELVDQVLPKLSAKYREILVLYYFEELSYEEIADVLHIPISTVGVRLARGRKAAKEAITRIHPNYEHPAN